MHTSNGSLPRDFLWGAATASYQTEGAAHEDGRGESVWDRFAATPGKVRNGDSGEIACDFYHRYRDDVALMGELGLDAIAAPLDFLGVNNYFRFVVGAGADGPRLVRNPEAEETDMGWEVYPDGLHRLLVRVAEEYEPRAIYVTENGAAFGDVRTHDGRVHDPERTAYLESHIGAVLQAVAHGAPVPGHFLWGPPHNFEWAYGYSKRFGIVYVDYDSQRRTPKDSARWYAGVARHNALAGEGAR